MRSDSLINSYFPLISCSVLQRRRVRTEQLLCRQRRKHKSSLALLSKQSPRSNCARKTLRSCRSKTEMSRTQSSCIFSPAQHSTHRNCKLPLLLLLRHDGLRSGRQALIVAVRDEQSRKCAVAAITSRAFEQSTATRCWLEISSTACFCAARFYAQSLNRGSLNVSSSCFHFVSSLVSRFSLETQNCSAFRILFVDA